jgi:hypothetical protein
MIIDVIIAMHLYTTPTQAIEIKTARAAEIPAQWHDFQECVAARESSGSYTAQNPTSSAQGKYQFLDNNWRHGGSWNVYKRLVKHGVPRREANRVRLVLKQAPIKTWRPKYQDILFAEVITSSEGMGWKHWFLAGSRCNRLAQQ